MSVFYNPHINEFHKPNPNCDYTFLLGVGYYWFYIGEL